MNKFLVFGALVATMSLASCTKTPTALFKYEQAQQIVPSKVTFKNESKDAKTYLWDFGDGKTSSEMVPAFHEYKEPGTYTVSLTVANGNKKQVATQTITVTVPKDADMYNYYHAKGNTFVVLETTFGNIKILLFDATPKHRDNFVKLVKQGFYNDLLFHRVIKGFMLQGGDPNSRGAAKGQSLGLADQATKYPPSSKMKSHTLKAHSRRHAQAVRKTQKKSRQARSSTSCKAPRSTKRNSTK